MISIIKSTISFFAPIIALSAVAALPLSGESRLELSTTPMIAAEHMEGDRINPQSSNGKDTFGGIPESAKVVFLLAGTGIIGLVCISRNKK